MTSSMQRRRLLGAAAFGLVAVATAASPAPAATAAMTFSVRPDPDGSLSPGGDYFVIEAEPGDTLSDAVEVFNEGARPVDVRLAAVDATTAQLGGVDYAPSESRPRATAKWLRLGRTSVTVAPGENRVVPFDVEVPQDAPPGTSLAGIAVWTPEPESKTEGLATVAVQTRRVVAVQVELPGPDAPALEIDGVTAVPRPDGLYLQVDLRNTGHGFAQGTGTIELDDGFSHEFALDKVVPGTGIGYPIKWSARAPSDGAYAVSVEIDHGAGVTRYRGEVLIGDGVREGLADRGVGGVKSGSRKPVVIAAAVTLILSGAAAVSLVRRRRSRRTRPPADPPPPPAQRPVESPAAPAAGLSRAVPPPPPPPPPPPAKGYRPTR